MSGDSNSFPHQSGVRETFSPADGSRGQPRPEHHLHRDSEPLPGSNPMTLSQEQSKDPGARENRPEVGTFTHICTSHTRRLTVCLGVTDVHQGTPDFQDPSFKQNAFNTERPLNVRPADQGGVAIDGRGDLPEGNANMTDKIVGKMQKVN